MGAHAFGDKFGQVSSEKVKGKEAKKKSNRSQFVDKCNLTKKPRFSYFLVM